MPRRSSVRSPRRDAVRRALCLLIMIGVLLPVPGIAQQDAPSDLSFPDMEFSWYRYRESVGFLRERGVISGYPDGTFQPGKTINRAEFLKLVFAARSATLPVATDCFRDVDPTSWYAPYVCAAKRRDIVSGYSDGTFKPEQQVNMAEAMKIALRTYRGDIKERPGAEWHAAYTDVLDRGDILPRDAYLPWEELTRERAADLITRLLRHEEEQSTLRRSPGCNAAEPSPPSSVVVDGQERSFLLTLPEGHDDREPDPLIIAFHGRTNSNEQVRSYMRLDRTASEFIIAYPAALKNNGGNFHWSTPGDPAGKATDVQFFDTLIRTLADHYCIDMDRIYVVGHSLGAWFANTLACVRGDVIRASGTVGGDGLLTPCAGPAAAMLMHHPRDPLAPFSATEKERDLRVKENACSAESNPIEPQSLKCQQYRGCDGGNDVIWCPHEIDIDGQGNRYEHQWPSGATEAIVSFFRKED